MAIALGLGLTGAAQAGLGDPADSVQRDATALRARTLATMSEAGYDLHEITTVEGTVVREYVSPAGVVFAVTWSGRNRPDLSILLGKHYDAYLKAASVPHVNHKVFSLQTDALVVRIMKLSRGFAGEAHVPAMLPGGTKAQDIQ